MATHPISLHGLKSHTLARIHDQHDSAKHIQPDSRFSSFTKTEGIRPPIHEDFTSFLASSTSQLQQQFSAETKASAYLQNRRFGSDNNTSDQKSAKTHHSPDKSSTILSMERIISSKPDIAKSAEAVTSSGAIQLPKQQIADKGYGSRTIVNPSITMACSADISEISMGLVNAVHENFQHQRDNSDSKKFSEPSEKIIKASFKTESSSRSEHAQLLRREEVEALREIKEKFQQQLNAQYPHITVPLKHPEGIMDIQMRFDRKPVDANSPNGSVRIMFSGSNDKITSLFSQHRDEFMKIIIQEGYSIDPSRIQFKNQNLPGPIII